MKFFDENAFGESVYVLADEHNELESYSYFTEAAEQMLHIKLINEGYTQELLDTIKELYRKQSPFIINGIFNVCKENRRLMHETVKTFCRDLTLTIKEDKRTLKENEEYVKNALSNPTITIPTSSIMYEFTHLDDDKIPNKEYLEKLVIELRHTKRDLRNGSSPADKRLVLDIAYHNMLDDINDKHYYNKARGNSLGLKDKAIKNDDFPIKIFEFFRNGGDMVNPTYKAKDLKNTVQRFNTYDRYILAVRHTLSIIEDAENEIDGSIRDIQVLSGNAVEDEKFLDVYNKYMMTLQAKLYELSSIIILTFSGKLDAISKSYVQDKNIIKQMIELGKTTGGVDNE